MVTSSTIPRILVVYVTSGAEGFFCAFDRPLERVPPPHFIPSISSVFSGSLINYSVQLTDLISFLPLTFFIL
jgi:hypothetical protein